MVSLFKHETGCVDLVLLAYTSTHTLMHATDRQMCIAECCVDANERTHLDPSTCTHLYVVIVMYSKESEPTPTNIYKMGASHFSTAYGDIFSFCS